MRRTLKLNQSQGLKVQRNPKALVDALRSLYAKSQVAPQRTVRVQLMTSQTQRTLNSVASFRAVDHLQLSVHDTRLGLVQFISPPSKCQCQWRFRWARS